jgi:outer membrane protein TolC
MDLVSETSLSNLAIPGVRQGTPADLITRRPDVAKAEAQLLAADANLAAARAAMLPRVTLTAGLSSESEKISRLLENPLSSLAAGFWLRSLMQGDLLRTGTWLQRKSRSL